MLKGGEIYTRSPATAIARAGTKWKVSTATGCIVADQVIIATQGATPKTLWPGLASSVIATPFYQAVTQPLTAAHRARVIPGREATSDMQGDIYFMRYDRFDRLVTGGTLIHETDWRRRLDRIVQRRLRHLFPYLPPLELSSHWIGKAALSTDFYPHLFSLAPGVWAWMGCNARGIAFSTSMGKVMSDLVLNGPTETTPLPIEVLRTRPFARIVSKLSLYSLLYYRMNDFWYRTRTSLARREA